jgi:hypothetical protein
MFWWNKDVYISLLARLERLWQLTATSAFRGLLGPMYVHVAIGAFRLNLETIGTLSLSHNEASCHALGSYITRCSDQFRRLSYMTVYMPFISSFLVKLACEWITHCQGMSAWRTFNSVLSSEMLQWRNIPKLIPQTDLIVQTSLC